MSEPKEAIYNVLAGRMVSDKDFMEQLNANPRGTIEKALYDAGIKPTANDLDDLEKEYQNFVADMHLTSAKKLTDEEIKPAVG